MKNEGLRTLANEEEINLGQKSQGNEVWSEGEGFWEVKRHNLSREIGEK